MELDEEQSEYSVAFSSPYLSPTIISPNSKLE